MKKTKILSFMLAATFLLSGCSMWDGSDTSNGTANQTNEQQPETKVNEKQDTMDNFMGYLSENGISVTDMKPIDNMDFAAYEGKSFAYNGNAAYLYRLKSEDANMSALLKDAKEKGYVKVSMDGVEQEYSASVNGNYLFLYEKDMDMHEVVTALGNYVPGATTTTPNFGGSKTTPTSGKEDTSKQTTDDKTVDDKTPEAED